MRRAIATGVWFRLALYGAYLWVRLWGMAADAAFPVWDGAGYFLKSIWMAQAPLTRIWPPLAFDFFPIRPPGPMWLTWPALAVRPTFTVFAVVLLFWQLVFIEIAVRGLFGGTRRAGRTPAAAILLAGSGVFFTGMQLFYVDPLLTAQTAAAIGLAAAWLRRARVRTALGLGLVLLLAICTKPTGLMLTASVGGALVLAVGARRLADGGGWRAILKCRPRAWLHALAVGVPLAGALAGMFLTKYGNIFVDFQGPMKELTLWRKTLESPFSWATTVTLARLVCETVGLPLVALLVVAGGASAWGVWRRRVAGRPLLVLAAVAAALMLAAMWPVPVKEHRYVAPAAMACLCLASGAIGWRRGGRKWLIACAVAAVVWRALVISDAVAYRHWLRGESFRAPVHHVRDFLHVLEKDIESRPDEKASLFACNLVADVDAASFVQGLRRWGLKAALGEMGVDFAVELHVPQFPNFGIEPLPYFVTATHLAGSAPDEFPFEPGSQAADWQRLNRLMWDVDTAERLGWRPLYRTREVVLYGPALGTKGPLAYAGARVRFLREHMTSPEARRILATFRMLAALRGGRPERRKVGQQSVADGAMGILIHAEYPGNPLPNTVRLEAREGDTLVFEARKAEMGDGVTICFRDESTDAVTTRSVGLGETVRVPVASLPGSGAVRTLTVEVTPGPAGDTCNDCVIMAIEGAE